ncbi:MAG: TIGR04076 family protein [Cyclobacteriaceae bacterium]
MSEQEFVLYDLKVETIEGEKPFVCSHEVGDSFEVRGENLIFPKGKPFSLYALSALLPLLTPKQRPLNQYDWMATDHIIACPDPHCGARFKISRIGKRIFKRADTTIVPLPEDNKDWQ